MTNPLSTSDALDGQPSFQDELADRRRMARVDAASLLIWIGTRLREEERRYERASENPDHLAAILSEGTLIDLRIRQDAIRGATTALATGSPLPPSFGLHLEWIEIDYPETPVQPIVARLLQATRPR